MVIISVYRFSINHVRVGAFSGSSILGLVAWDIIELIGAINSAELRHVVRGKEGN